MLRIEIDELEPLRGLVRGEPVEGAIAFTGWLGMIRAIEAMVTAASPGAPDIER